MNCRECKKPITRSYGGCCQGCYLYFRKGGKINALPAKGEVQFDDRGYCICHICGRSFKRLGSHIKESHNMTIKEYKEEFELCYKTKTTEQAYSNHMRENAIKNGMASSLPTIGEPTRFTTKRMKGGTRRCCKENVNIFMGKQLKILKERRFNDGI